MTISQIKIAVIEDEHFVRKSFSLLIEKEKNFQVIFEGENGNELIRYLETNRNHPDIVTMDIRMKHMNGIETTRIVSERFPNIKIIILSSLKTPYLVQQLANYGAVAYLEKKSHPKLVVETINQVYTNGIHFEPEVMRLIVNMKSEKRDKTDNQFYELSEREIEILTLISNQYNTKGIAEKLFISERTVEGYRKCMLEKTASKNIAGLIMWGIQNQVLSID